MDCLKIDKSFVHDIGTSDDGAVIVRTIISMGRSLQLHVVGEGVETPQQLEFLRQHGCEEAQGFLLARPMPADELSSVMAAGSCSAGYAPRLAVAG